MNPQAYSHTICPNCYSTSTSRKSWSMSLNAATSSRTRSFSGRRSDETTFDIRTAWSSAGTTARGWSWQKTFECGRRSGGDDRPQWWSAPAGRRPARRPSRHGRRRRICPASDCPSVAPLFSCKVHWAAGRSTGEPGSTQTFDHDASSARPNNYWVPRGVRPRSINAPSFRDGNCSFLNRITSPLRRTLTIRTSSSSRWRPGTARSRRLARTSTLSTRPP